MKNLAITLSLICLQSLLFSQQVPKGLTAANGQFVGFYEFTPYNYNSSNAKYPLIIFLHGVGERGNGTSELYKVAWNAIPKYCANGATMTFTYNGQEQSFMVLSPQLSSSYGQWENFYVEEMIKYAKNNLRVDPARIYLCGLSLGGGGVWKFASASTANALGLAAIAPVCATNDGNTYCNIAQSNLPVWAFHAEDDGVVGVGNTRYVLGQINACSPGVVPRATYYTNGGHGIWDRAFDLGHTFQNPENVYEWFLSKTRGTPAPPPPPPANKPPVAYAGQDITITLPTANVVLNGSGSADSDGTITSYSWSKISGPAKHTVINATSVTTDVTNLEEGSYTFRLTVTDNNGATASDDIVITVNAAAPLANRSPVAAAGNDFSMTLPLSNTTLDGSSSTDPDGTIVAYAWSKISGPGQYAIASPNNAATQISNLAQGVYTFRLMVTDNNGATASDDVLITVSASAVNQQPVANAGPDATITLPTSSIILNGSGSSDTDGSIVSYAWSQVGGPSATVIANPATANTTVSNLSSAGTYYFQLIVGDNAGGASTDLVIITVNTGAAVNQQPVANAGADFSVSLPVSSITLNGSASTDADGTITTYAWSQVGGPTATIIANAGTATTTAGNFTTGMYYFQLIVGDNAGGASTDLLIVTVNAAPPASNQSPVARAGSDIALTLPTNSATVSASASADPDGSLVSYAWSKISGPASYSIANPSSVSTSLTGLAAGTYNFRVQVTDNNGATATDDIQVVVNSNTATANQLPVANAGPDVTITLPANSSVLDATRSYDPDGSISYYGWSRLSGPTSYSIANPWGRTTALTNLAQGTYSFLLVVTDNKGDIHKDTVKYTVNAATTATLQNQTTNNTGLPALIPANANNLAATFNQKEGLIVYPNPAIHQLNVLYQGTASGKIGLVITDAAGRTMLRQELLKEQNTINRTVNIANLKPGMYYVEIRQANGIQSVRAFTKQ
jgi:predicted esterase/uncharacterized protein (DUF2141 family)